MLQRYLLLASICLALFVNISVNQSQGATLQDTLDTRRATTQPMISVRVLCEETGPHADVSWTNTESAESYTLMRMGEEDGLWSTVGENLEQTTFTDTTFPTTPDMYQYQIIAGGSNRHGVESPTIAVNIPSCGTLHSPDTELFGEPETTFQPEPETPFQPAIAPAIEETGGTDMSAAAVATNLIQNPSFEIVGTHGDPQYWHRAGWGTNDGTYIYPTLGKDGGKAAKVEMTSRTSGDVKWYFEDVPVKPGTKYTISHTYRATRMTELTARFKGPNGIQYQYQKMLPEASNWSTSSVDITIPANVTSMTLFHILYSPGSLEIDSFTMAPTTLPPLLVTPPPLPPPSNLIKNPSLETTGASGDPLNWFRGGWGTNKRTFTYPVAGADGSKAAKVEITSYTDGDAKWYFEDVPVTGGKTYDLSHLYKANTPTDLLARFTTSDSNIEYRHIASLPAASSWTSSAIQVTTPTNASKFTLFHVLKSLGVLQIDAFNMSEYIKEGTGTPIPTPEPTPTSPPDTTAEKYIMLNAINWNTAALKNLPLNDASEITYFVLPVSASGVLMGMSPIEESAFVKNVHAAGKLATFSIAGGDQNIEDITVAVMINRTDFINNIAEHIAIHGYDGVTIDIEGTNILAQAMTDFIRALRLKMDAIRQGLIIGIYTQPHQINTVWASIADVASSITWLAPMIYDSEAFTPESLTSLTKAWESKIGKEKLLSGVAVNYPSEKGGLSPQQFKNVLDIITANGWKGVGIWENTLYTQPWLDVRRATWPTIQ